MLRGVSVHKETEEFSELNGGIKRGLDVEILGTCWLQASKNAITLARI